MSIAAVFKEAQIKVDGRIGKIHKDFVLPGPSNACGNYGFDCPVKVGENYKMGITLPISTLYPKYSIEVRFQMFDEHKYHIACFTFPVKLT